MPGFIAVLIHDFIRPTKESTLRKMRDFGHIICDKFNFDRANLYTLHHRNPYDNTVWWVVLDNTFWRGVRNDGLVQHSNHVMTECIVGSWASWIILTDTVNHHEYKLRLIKLSISKTPSKITTCGCGSSISNKPKAIKAHRNSSKHLKWIDT